MFPSSLNAGKNEKVPTQTPKVRLSQKRRGSCVSCLPDFFFAPPAEGGVASNTFLSGPISRVAVRSASEAVNVVFSCLKPGRFSLPFVCVLFFLPGR